MKVAALLLTPLLGVLTLVVGVVVVLSPSDSAAAALCAPSMPVEADVTDLDERQLANARTIVRVGRQLDVPPRGLVVAVATALQESTLLNLPFGDRDSVGLFQQRDAWGPRAVRMSPSGSATMFYVGGRGGQPGLLDIDGWQQMSIAESAQSVQVSAFPGAYARWESLAVAVVRQISGLRAACLDAGTWILPLERGTYTLTARFGVCGARWESCHTGLDFAAVPGTPVMAVASGRVTASSTDSAYGNVVRIRHTGGVSTWYAHLQRRIAAPGAQVTAGDVIGLVGSTGNSTGPHLHLEIRTAGPGSSGTPTDPYRWLVEHEATP